LKSFAYPLGISLEGIRFFELLPLSYDRFVSSPPEVTYPLFPLYRLLDFTPGRRFFFLHASLLPPFPDVMMAAFPFTSLLRSLWMNSPFETFLIRFVDNQVLPIPQDSFLAFYYHPKLSPPLVELHLSMYFWLRWVLVPAPARTRSKS